MTYRRALLIALAVALPAADRGLEIEDRLDIVHVDNRLIAVNAATGALLEARLEVDERVLEVASQGRVGVVVTNVRLLGVGTPSSRWQELRFRKSERASAPPDVHIEDRVALVPLATRLAVLGGENGRWSELPLGPGEARLRVLADTGLATVLTSRRAIAITPDGAFIEVGLTPQEVIEATSTRPDSITLTTSHRVLVFRSGALRWAEIRRIDRRH
jgi:hypothetical protein